MICPVHAALYLVLDLERGIVGTVGKWESGVGNYMFQTNQGPSFPAHHFLFGGRLRRARLTT